MAETYRVQNLSEALDLAENFKLSGKYNLFRGQAQNWKVQSTIGRLSKKSQKQIEDKLIRLYEFFETESSLKKYYACPFSYL
jgi:hypothetical protein